MSKSIKQKPLWGEKLPYMYSQFTNSKRVHLWDSFGFTRELTKENLEEIQRLEEMGKKEKIDLKVVAVIDGMYSLDGESVNMITYVYITNEYDPWLIEEDCVGFDSYVHNKTWDIKESGSVGLYERVGCLRRRY